MTNEMKIVLDRIGRVHKILPKGHRLNNSSWKIAGGLAVNMLNAQTNATNMLEKPKTGISYTCG